MKRGQAREDALFGDAAQPMDGLATRLDALQSQRDTLLKQMDAAVGKTKRKADIRKIQAPFMERIGAITDSIRREQQAGFDAMDQVLKGMKAKTAERMVLSEKAVTTAQAVERVKIADQYSPIEINSLRRNLADFFDLFGEDSVSVLSIVKAGPRPGCDPIGIMINMGDKAQDRLALFHEMGHSLEETSRTVKIAQEWIRRRATGPSELLSKLTGIDKYRPDERAFPGPFYDAYVGKDFRGSEVMSTGLEKFASGYGLLELFLKDREHFRLILGLLKL
jgi:hypothetical protein